VSQVLYTLSRFDGSNLSNRPSLPQGTKARGFAQVTKHKVHHSKAVHGALVKNIGTEISTPGINYGTSCHQNTTFHLSEVGSSSKYIISDFLERNLNISGKALTKQNSSTAVPCTLFRNSQLASGGHGGRLDVLSGRLQISALAFLLIYGEA